MESVVQDYSRHNQVDYMLADKDSSLSLIIDNMRSFDQHICIPVIRAGKFTGRLATWLLSVFFTVGFVNAAVESGDEASYISFLVGEQLVHRIHWGVFPVGTSVTSSRWVEVDGRRLIALRIRTRTNRFFDRIRRVDDLVESIVDPETFLPVTFRRLMMRRRQGCDEYTTFDFDNLSAVWSDKCSGEVKQFTIDPDTRDILTFLYYMRRKQLDADQSGEYRVMADDGMFELKIKTGGKEGIQLPVFGQVSSLSVIPEFDFDGVLVDSGKFRLWISDDARRILTSAQIAGSMADIRLTLSGVRGPGDDLWIKSMEAAGESTEPVADAEIEKILD